MILNLICDFLLAVSRRFSPGVVAGEYPHPLLFFVCSFRVNKPRKKQNQNDKFRTYADLSRAKTQVKSTHLDQSGTQQTIITEY